MRTEKTLKVKKASFIQIRRWSGQEEGGRKVTGLVILVKKPTNQHQTVLLLLERGNYTKAPAGNSSLACTAGHCHVDEGWGIIATFPVFFLFPFKTRSHVVQAGFSCLCLPVQRLQPVF